MKRQLIYIAALTALLTGCMDFDDAAQSINVDIQVTAPEGFSAMDISGRNVTMNSTTALSATTDANGRVTFTNIVPEVYNISTSWKISSDEYKAITGKSVGGKSFTVVGNMASQLLNSSTTTPLSLTTTIVEDQMFLISKVQYQGCKNDLNKNYIYGKYVELYNNSDQTISTKGLYLVLMESVSSGLVYPLDQITDTVIGKQVFQIPEKTIAPGGTLLLVNSAVDHTTKGASAAANLLDADYEAKDMSSKANAHENNPAIPALPLLYTAYSTLTYMNLVNGGPCSLALVQTDEDTMNDWIKNKLTYGYSPKSKTTLYIKIPTKYIIDAVEILKYNSSTGVDLNSKRFYNYLDAGYTCTTASYDGKIVVRKTSHTTEDGRKVLMDTNNSTNDFEVSDELKPREYK